MKPRIRVLIFSSKTCGVCIAQEKSGIYEEFKEENPGVIVQKLCVADEHGDSPALGGFEEAKRYSEALEVRAMPTYFFELEGAGIVHNWEGGGSKPQMRKLFKQGMEVCEEILSSMAAVKFIPWPRD